MTRHHYAASLSWGGDTPTAELEVEVSYTVAWGAPEQGPSYASGGQPADPDEIDDIQVEKINGELPKVFSLHMPLRECLNAITGKLIDEHSDAMIDAARETEAAREDDASEHQREDW